MGLTFKTKITAIWILYLCFGQFVVRCYDPSTCITCRESHVCNPPDCFCCRDTMPLETQNIPQMVFFTFDDAVTPQVANYYRELFEPKRKNPNGCPISMTLFISHKNTVYSLVKEFYDKGMEIASHSVTHGHPSSRTFAREAKKQKENLSIKTGIPESKITGWRSPFLEPLGDTQPSVLKELGYEYDATLTITPKANNDKAITPFTLDYGWPYDCKIKPCPSQVHKGFWEVPVISVKDYLNKYDCVYIDGCNNPPPSETLAYKFLWDNFQRYYKGNRAPMGINMHASWFYYPDRKAAMDRFIKKLGQLDDVFIISIKQVIDWLKEPTPLNQLNHFGPWQCTGDNNSTGTASIQQQSAPQLRLQQVEESKSKRRRFRMHHMDNQRRTTQSVQDNRENTWSDQSPSVPRILPSPRPPLVPNLPMVRFWWQPPALVAAREMEYQRNLHIQQALQERQRQEDLERRRYEEEQRQLEIKRQAEERARLLEVQRRQQQLDLERQREALRQKEFEKRRLEEEKRLQQQRRQELAKKKEFELQKKLEMQKQEELRQQEIARQMQIEREKLEQQERAEIQKQRQRLEEQQRLQKKEDLRQKEITKQKEMQRQRNMMIAQEEIMQTKRNHASSQVEPNAYPDTMVPEVIYGLNTVSPTSSRSLRRYGGLDEAIARKLDNILQYQQGSRIQMLEQLSLTELKALQTELRNRLLRHKSLRDSSDLVHQVSLTDNNGQMVEVLSDAKNTNLRTYMPSGINIIHNNSPAKVDFKDSMVMQEFHRSSGVKRTRINRGEAVNELNADKTSPNDEILFKEKNQNGVVGKATERRPDSPTTLKQTSATAQTKTPIKLPITTTPPTTTTTTKPTTTTTTQSPTTTTPTTPTTTTTLTTTTTTTASSTTTIPTTTPTTTTTPKTTTPTTTTPTTTTPKTTTPTTTTPTTTTPKTTTPTTTTPTTTTTTPTTTTPTTTTTTPTTTTTRPTTTTIVTTSTTPSTTTPITTTPTTTKAAPTTITTTPTTIMTIKPQTKTTTVSSTTTSTTTVSITPTTTTTATATTKRHVRPSQVRSKSMWNAAGFDNLPLPWKTLMAESKVSDNNQTSSHIYKSFPKKENKPSSVKLFDVIGQKSRTRSLFANFFLVNNKTPVSSKTRKTVEIPPSQETDIAIAVSKTNSENNYTESIESTPTITITTTTLKSTTPLVTKTKPRVTVPRFGQPFVHSGTAIAQRQNSCMQGVNCHAPDCVCKTETTPHGLKASDIPQMIYITLDGSLNFHSYSQMRALFSPKRFNPNGCRIKGTVFVSDTGSSYRITDALHRDGIEIALMGLTPRPQTNATQMQNEINVQRNQILQGSSLTAEEIKGWRSPSYKPAGDGQFEVLSRENMYDSTLIADRTASSKPKLWPFTLDFGWTERCEIETCPDAHHAGVWEVPVIPMVGPSNSTSCDVTDGCPRQPNSKKETFEYLMTNFNTYYKTNKAPFAIRLKQIWFHWFYRENMAGLFQFLDTVLGYGDVYATSVSDMIEWIKSPILLKDIKNFDKWSC